MATKKDNKVDKVQLEINKARNGRPSKISKNSILAKAPAVDTVEGNLWASMGKEDARIFKDQSKVAKRREQIRKNAGGREADLYMYGASEIPLSGNKTAVGRQPDQAKRRSGNSSADLQERKNKTAKKKTAAKAGAKKISKRK